MIRLAASLLVAGTLLSGCLGTSVPTQSNPSCSWDSSVPAHASSICTSVFHTLSSIAAALQTGNDAAIRRLVSSGSVRHKLVNYGRGLRAQGVRNLHVVPSITLDQLKRGSIGAGFYVNGNITGGRVNAPQTVELRLVHGRASVINDQPGQEW